MGGGQGAWAPRSPEKASLSRLVAIPSRHGFQPVPMKKLSVFFLLALLAGIRPAQAVGRDAAREAVFEQELAKQSPALVEPFRQATQAQDREDYAESVRLFRDIVLARPDFEPARRRLGFSLIRLGQAGEGMALLEETVRLNRSPENLYTLAYTLAYPPTGRPTDSGQVRALDLMKECMARPDGQDDDMLIVTAQLAFAREEKAVAREAVRRLQKDYPELMVTRYFAAIVAAMDEHWIEAEDEINAAGKLGLDATTVANFLASGIHTQARIWRWLRGAGWTVGLWAGGMLLLCGLGFLLSAATLRQIDRADPRIPVGAAEQRLRKIYRQVLNLTGAYYYVSLPVVALLLVLVCGGIIYGFLLIGQIPIQIAIILIVGMLATLWSMGRSLFLRVKSQDPGRALNREEAAGLWQLSEQVARDLGTRPIDEIRITPGTDLCVYERGSWREKLNNRAPRILLVGTGMLNGFETAHFRSVLAHEYGHFSNRDTAGGDVAMRVQNDMLKFYYAMVGAGQATWLNVAFHFLRAYNFIFRRISHGATRLQEVLADRVAVLHYGPAAFEGGLRHVIRRSLAFNFVVEREVGHALKASQPVVNLYALPQPTTDHLHQEYEKVLAQPTTADDTHPAPRDRLRLVARLPEPAVPAPSGLVWDLFNDKEAIMQEMMKLVEQNIARHRSS